MPQAQNPEFLFLSSHRTNPYNASNNLHKTSVAQKKNINKLIPTAVISRTTCTPHNSALPQSSSNNPTTTPYRHPIAMRNTLNPLFLLAISSSYYPCPPPPVFLLHRTVREQPVNQKHYCCLSFGNWTPKW